MKRTSADKVPKTSEIVQKSQSNEQLLVSKESDGNYKSYTGTKNVKYVRNIIKKRKTVGLRIKKRSGSRTEKKLGIQRKFSGKIER